MISAGKRKSHSIGWLFCVLCCLSFLGLTACGGSPELVKLSGQTMGTTWHVSYLPEGRTGSLEELEGAIQGILDDINRSMSTYQPDSEISRFNRAGTDEWHTVSADFLTVLEAALYVGEGSRGAYDVTVAPLVDRWGFGSGPIENPGLPSDSEIKDILSRIGQHKLRVDPTRFAIRKTVDVSLDFSSIAKGYAVDKVAQFMASQDIRNFLVEVGGEMRLAGLSARGDAWRIAIEQPDSMGGIAQAIALSDQAVATSGDYRNYFERDGKRYSHSIDPRTGSPVIHGLVSVTVVHPSAMMADAWATALTVLGADEAMEVAQEQALAVYFILREGEHYSSRHSAAFAPYLQAGDTGK